MNSVFQSVVVALALLFFQCAAYLPHEAGAVEQIHNPDRKPLPGFGPSYKKSIHYGGGEAPGTIVISTREKSLYVVKHSGMADKYRISIGREGFGWTGRAYVGAKKEWPEWRPPVEMRNRDPGLPESVPAGPYNPLGARALYLYSNNKDTLYRIHGTNNPDGVGFDGTSGCFRLTNTDIIELFDKIPVGTKVIVK